MLVSVSDADMLPSAYIDGKLGPSAGADALSVIRLDRPDGRYTAAEVPVGNSVTGPPASIAVTPDGRFAIVIETTGARPVGVVDPMITDLAIGRAITVVDLSVPDRPRIVQRIEGFAGPLSVSVNAAGSLVAVSYASGTGTDATPPLVVYRFVAGRLTAAMKPSIPGWIAGEALIGTDFHPREDVLALVNVTSPAVSFVRIVDTPDGGLVLSTWGNAIDVEKAPYLVRFTPDGRHVLTNGTYAAVAFNLSGAPRGTISSIRVAATKAADGTPQHRLVSRAQTGVIPEGLSVSPDGRWIITANLENSTPATSDPTMRRFGSMTLIRLDPDTGLLDRVGDFAFDGALPEMAVFDNASRFVAVTVFSQFDDPRAKGSIDFWRIETDASDPRRVELVKTRHSIPVTRGAHSMAIVR